MDNYILKKIADFYKVNFDDTEDVFKIEKAIKGRLSRLIKYEINGESTKADNKRLQPTARFAHCD